MVRKCVKENLIIFRNESRKETKIRFILVLPLKHNNFRFRLEFFLSCKFSFRFDSFQLDNFTFRFDIFLRNKFSFLFVSCEESLVQTALVIKAYILLESDERRILAVMK